MAGEYTCSARTSWLENTQGYSETDACKKVAGMEFPDESGKCNPDTFEETPPPSTILSLTPSATPKTCDDEDKYSLE